MALSWKLIEESSVHDDQATPENPVMIGSYHILTVTQDGQPINTGEFKISLGANIIIEGPIQAGKSGPLVLDRQKVWYNEYEVTIYLPNTRSDH